MQNAQINRLAKLLILVGLTVMAAPANADFPRHLIAQNRQSEAPVQLISSDRAAQIAQSSTGGRVLSVKLRKGKRPVYQVKVLMDAKRVRTVNVDARTGSIR